MASAEVADRLLITSLDDLQIEENPFAEGFLWNVHRGRYHGHPVAVKKLKQARSLAPLKKEVETWRRLTHPNILPLLGYTELPLPPMIVMELMDGSLFDLLHNRAVSLSLLRRVEIAFELASAVSYLHEKQFLHRDIRSFNVLVRGNDVMLADVIGVAVLDCLEIIPNTPIRWAAPELFSSKDAFSQFSDVYAMGITLSEILTRERPYPQPWSVRDISRAITTGSRPQIWPPTAGMQELLIAEKDLEKQTAGFRQLIERCWQEKPRLRPSAGQVRMELGDLLKNLRHDQQLASADLGRDVRLMALFLEKKIPQAIQDKLFDEELVDFEGIEFVSVELLQRVGLPEVRAKLLLKALQQLAGGGASSSTPDPDQRSKRTIPHLTNEDPKPIASGAQGTIHLAKFHGAPCVVKRFIRGVNRPEFDRETKAWKKFHHPNIVHLLAFLGPPDAVIVMERMACSLYDMLKDKSKSLSFFQRVEMGGQIAAGVSYLHAKDFVHRDIKSLNVLVRGREVKLADFGDTQSADQLHSLMSLRGTPRWIAPELYNKSKPSNASDVYAMGMTLWELLCRKTPFWELHSDALAITKAVSERKRPEFAVYRELGDVVGEDAIERFKELINSCWSQEPWLRPTAENARLLLEQILMVSSPIPTPIAANPQQYSVQPDYGNWADGSFTGSSSTPPPTAPSGSLSPPITGSHRF